ncbi:MAG: TSUP family transporter, partial [Anaerolineae bacterium]|nr:TSUP family transporter [Anaerolineae bacterium]
MQIDIFGFILAGLGALAAGFINAMAGGGTLVSFPTLTFIGLPAVAANVTNTVALCPGYVGGIWSQWKDLKDQKHLLRWYMPAGALGGLIGGFLLLHSG